MNKDQKKQFTHLRKAVIKDITADKKKTIAIIRAVKSASELYCNYYISQVLTASNRAKTLAEQKNIAIRKIDKYFEKKTQKALARIEKAENTIPSNDLTININWKRNSTWGSNPTAESWGNGYHSSKSISGCGYDKGSTAMADAINQDYGVLHLMYALENKRLGKREKVERRQFMGYGSGYGVLPYFEGGVGISSLVNILKNIGYSTNWTSGKTWDSITATLEKAARV